MAYQAGVLQVWLDEAGIEFDHADGASGGVFNLAMYCQGLTGRQIADNWRNFPVLGSISLNWRQYLRLFWAESLLSYERFRRVVLCDRWRLDWPKIRLSSRSATFNAYDFTQQRLVVRTQDEVCEDFMIAGVSLPGWFSPVRIGGSLFIDAVYVTDANLIDAIERGADELWIIWTVNRGGVWKGGFINTYFQIIEASADGNLNRDLARINANNEAIEGGEAGEFGRKITVQLLIGRVDLNYLINFRSRKFTAAVEQGIADAREWCSARGIRCRPPTRLRDALRAIQGPPPEDAPTPQFYLPVIVGGRFDPHVTPVAAHNELTIKAAPERIWPILVRARNWPRWYENSSNVRVEQDSKDLFPGADFTWCTFGVCLRSEVKEFEPGRRIAWTGKTIGVDIYHAWRIEPTEDGGCRVITEETQYGWLARAANWLMPDRIHNGHRLWLESLAVECGKQTACAEPDQFALTPRE